LSSRIPATAVECYQGSRPPAASEVFTDAERTAPYNRKRGHDPMNLASLDAFEDAGRWRLCRLTRQISRVGIHHSWGDRASRRTLIALRKNHHTSGVALKVLATWAGAVIDSDPYANFYTPSKKRSSVTAEVLRKWRLSPVLSPCSRPRSTWIVAGVAAVAIFSHIPKTSSALTSKLRCTR
jgi:hypothetical protein